MPKALDRHLPGDGDGGRVQQFGDARSDEGGADDDLTIPVDEDPGPAPVVGAVLEGSREVADLVVGDLDVPPGALGLSDGQTHGGDLGIGEDDTRDGLDIGRAAVRGPAAGVEFLAPGPAGDHGPGDAGLVLALAGEEGAAIDVAHGVQPVPRDGGDGQAVVGGEPVPRLQSHGVEPDVLRARGAAGGRGSHRR
ncbi:hypothetical protein GCM10017744_091560 [Streptomyces antimycoticus]|uniref:Uncharacterized protein n=1 Tax=Streptomyces antimycoticus TaxID=68175 RepID=A0A4D4JUX9_9ACTN|nr:hypothetical protein SANT12839_003540 [Streptomyces antimycoticus]